MEILVYPWHSYNYRDVEATFKKLGHNITYIEYHIENYDMDDDFKALARKMFREKKYDFVFTINYFSVISEACEEAGMPYVSWTCDNPLIAMYNKSVFNDCNYIFTFDQTNWAEFRARGCKHIYYLPLAVDAPRIDAYLNRSTDLFLYKNDVSFVGGLYEKNTYDKVKGRLPEYLRGYMEATIVAQLNISGGNIVEKMITPEIEMQLGDYFNLEKSENSFSSLALIFSTTVLGFKVASETRHSALIRLGKNFQTALFTNSRVQDLPGVDLRGEVDYWTQMPKVFRACRINLNFTIPNIVSGLPLRVFDILGAGGFLMTNYQAELPLFFKRGVDLEYFEDEDELIEKTKFYLEHEDIREKIAKKGLANVMEHHTYDIRLRQLLDIFEKKLPDDDPMIFMKA